MKDFKHRIEYALVRVFDLFFRLLPRPMAIATGEAIGTLMSFIIYKRDRLILSNLAHAFPEKTLAERKRIARAVWRNLGRTAVEFIRSKEYSAADLARYVEWENGELIDQAVKGGHGVIMLTAHFTNWEILGMAVQARYSNMMAISRPMKNPYVEKWVQAKRSSGGMTIILHREAVKASLKWVKSKNIVGILVDQNLYTGGVFVDFFGRPAATTTLPALLHIRTGEPMFLLYILRVGNKFRVVIEPIMFPKVANEDERPLVYTQTISNAVERLIRKYPENWFWIHNRWKRKPE